MKCENGIVEFKQSNELYIISDKKNKSCCPVRGEHLDVEVFNATNGEPIISPNLPYIDATRSYGSFDCKPCNDPDPEPEPEPQPEPEPEPEPCDCIDLRFILTSIGRRDILRLTTDCCKDGSNKISPIPLQGMVGFECVKCDESNSNGDIIITMTFYTELQENAERDPRTVEIPLIIKTCCEQNCYRVS